MNMTAEVTTLAKKAIDSKPSETATPTASIDNVTDSPIVKSNVRMYSRSVVYLACREEWERGGEERKIEFLIKE